MNRVQEVFEQAFRSIAGEPCSSLWFKKFESGRYKRPHIQRQYEFFVLGLACGKVVARPGFKLVEVPLEPGDLDG